MEGPAICGMAWLLLKNQFTWWPLTLALAARAERCDVYLVSTFLLRRPSGREPERVAVVTSVNPVSGFQSDANPVSAPNYLAWREANHVFADAAAADEYRRLNLTSQGQPEAIPTAAVLNL
jgi:hypothetical protein